MPDLNTIEESLSKIETGIRQLKLQYDMFFAGVQPRQPYELRKDLEIALKTLGNTAMQRFSDRYRFNSLATRYQTMAELWGKMLRAKEEGRLRPGIPGFVEPVRKRAATPATPAAGVRTAEGPVVHRFSTSRPSAEDPSLRMFYDKFVEASKTSRAGDSKSVSYRSFLKQIEARTKSIKEKAGCDTVSYSIVVKDGGVTLKAIPGKRKDGSE
ncbi:MAG TPA: MXAN_5187 C-terminal domain-containing protein [Candidatus Polarisedimenticolia bacterium]|jgi:hypothetical protein